MRGNRLAAAALLSAAATLAAATPAEVQRWSVDPHTTGLLVEDHRAPLVTLQLEFPVGWWSTWTRRAGAERAFSMQLHDPHGRLRREADRLGLEPIVHVGPRSASLRVVCLRADLEASIGWLSSVLANEAIDRSEVRRRVRELRLSWRLAMKTPRFRARREHARLLFTEGDPRRLPFEPPARLKRSAVELVRARDRVLGMPGRIVAFAGDLDAADAARLARGLLPAASDLEPPPPGLLELRSPRPADGDVEVSLAGLTQVYFSYGRESLSIADPDYPAFLVADHVLGGHFYSRLYRALRHESGETYGAVSTDYGDVTTNLYALTTFTRTENAERTERKLREVLERFHREGITELEAREAVGFLRGRLAFARQAPEQIMDRHLRERRLHLPSGFHDDQVERAARLDLASINAFIERFYEPAGFVMVRVGPAK